MFCRDLLKETAQLHPKELNSMSSRIANKVQESNNHSSLQLKVSHSGLEKRPIFLFTDDTVSGKTEHATACLVWFSLCGATNQLATWTKDQKNWKPEDLSPNAIAVLDLGPTSCHSWTCPGRGLSERPYGHRGVRYGTDGADRVCLRD
ncbi:hypothetical protein IscW_ISCW022068 [Ixodes scapularis]|uniref:Uncharacterized protein n=1 Tax=Ixodes scapularis TaxID=6945 RepID=B7QDJ7_IXOSC|nr:hypothetical protein IscW_ISCW022068 [Ixodes scapularis]|eukprot:XP_002413611.1 hypothetical protein IscW_ISCW022068 [Ixodes scapularis]